MDLDCSGFATGLKIISEPMKVKNKILLITLALGLAGTPLVAQPSTAELKEPTAIRVVGPVVPYDFARMQVRGNVEVTFRINEKGRPTDITVEEASHSEYAESVKNALRQWRFEEPMQSGIKYRLPVIFN